jgi:hypothetical protein
MNAMTKDDMLLWMIALDYAATEAVDLEEYDFLKAQWDDVRDVYSCTAGRDFF